MVKLTLASNLTSYEGLLVSTRENTKYWVRVEQKPQQNTRFNLRNAVLRWNKGSVFRERETTLFLGL